MSRPVWGLCRHGRVRNNQLLLPNGSTIAYAQPPGVSVVGQGATVIRDTAGYTLEIKVPYVAEVVRTPGEAANDFAKGYVWQNTATISGGSRWVARRALGNNGWIYCAPDGSRWLVQTIGITPGAFYSTTSPLNFTLRLKRFGELLGTPEQHDFPMVMPTLGKDNGRDWPGNLSTAMLWVATATSDGTRAVIEVSNFSSTTTSSTPQNSLEERDVFAFHEFVLSGIPGVDFVSQLTLLYSASQVFVLTQDDTTTMKQEWYAGWTNTTSSGVWYSGPEKLSNSIYPSPIAASNSGVTSGFKICAIWYKDLVPVPVILFVKADITLNLPPPTGESYTSSSSWTYEGWLEWGDVKSAIVHASGESQGSWTLPKATSQYTNTITTTLASFDYDTGIPDLVTTVVRDWQDLSQERFLPGADLPRAAVNPGGSSGDMSYYNIGRMANYVLSVTHSRSVSFGTTGSTYRTIFPPLTPSNPVTGANIKTVTTHTFRYGSYNPATGDTVWGSTVPVCYV